ncbi:MAG: mannose-1-phosphate guanylyltransferase/mannose-6-phosphate isomerase [Methanobacteriota archaeon]|nr:MAG: mannose-1-phosphate guanylyltransferase/mannose-6-phosphate isomerase [Euryarchaeota archaeon]
METIVLAGGSGTRLYPLSRKLMPKQFIKLFGGDGEGGEKGERKSLYQLTLERASKFSHSITVVTSKEQEFLAKNQALEIGKKVGNGIRFLIEPSAKNTFPAIFYGVMESKEDEILVMPSDHYIGNTHALIEAVERAKKECREGIVLFGIVPTHAHTGYGYIVRGEKEKEGLYCVKEFREKPEREVAEKLIEEGGYWNSGMFLFSKDTFIEESKGYDPHILEKYGKGVEEFYDGVEANSIDYAIMEKTKKAKVMAVNCSWSDVGNFNSLYEILKKNGNAYIGNVKSKDTKDSLLIGKRLIITLGLSDVVVVDDRDVLLVANRNRAEEVKKVVEELRKEGDSRADIPPTVYRPWGNYTVLEEGLGYKVKKIVVMPGKSISLQKHRKRAEHWVVVKGRARVRVGEEVKELAVDESYYVPKETIHRIENPYNEAVEIIEVQTGEYLGEDDIERFSNYFGGQKNE